jgi:hypothetical protein
VTTLDGRLWTPRGYALTGTHPDGSVRTLTPGIAEGDTPDTRRTLALDLVHLANGLTRTERRVWAATRAGATTYRDIAAAAGCGLGTITAAADHFEQLGYISRPVDAAERRYIELAPSWR